MSNNDLLVVISEMLVKQDQHTELIRETNNTLKEFMNVSIQQFENQHSFNEKQLAFNEQQQEFNRQQQNFNERVLNRLDSIDNHLQKVLDMDLRIKRLEAAVFK